MTRVKSVASRRHRKVKLLARGFKNASRKRVKGAKEALLHAGQYAYAGRKLRRRDLRKLWIIRINAAARENGTTYKDLIFGLKKNKIELDRKILAELAVNDPASFKAVVSKLSKA